MDMQRKYAEQSAKRQESGQARMLNVGLPLPYEGVGKALRKTFGPGRAELPDDMLSLLARLDRV